MDNQQPFLLRESTDLSDLLEAGGPGAGLRVADRSITITACGPSGLVVDADPDRLRQAVDNLLDNATRYAPDRSTVELTCSADARGTVDVAVPDCGPGFPPEFLPHAFERFHRAEAARSRDSGGTGLGLSIVAAIAEAHGGTATAVNRTCGSAQVSLHLPIAALSTSP